MTDTSPVHELTVEIEPDVYDPALWRVTGTCACLGFGRTAAAKRRVVAEAAIVHFEQHHMIHMARMAAHPDQLPDPSEWLS